jgi:hypothetical protein
LIFAAAFSFMGWAMIDPPPGDAYRLPPLAVLREGRLYNMRYRRHLDDRLLWEDRGRATIQMALDEATVLYWIWDDAEGAHPDFKCYGEAKAAYLRRLRLALGRDDYDKMELPPCVPYWRFKELKH